MLHGFQKKIDGFLSDTKSDSTEKIRSGLTNMCALKMIKYSTEYINATNPVMSY